MKKNIPDSKTQLAKTISEMCETITELESKIYKEIFEREEIRYDYLHSYIEAKYTLVDLKELATVLFVQGYTPEMTAEGVTAKLDDLKFKYVTKFLDDGELEEMGKHLHGNVVKI